MASHPLLLDQQQHSIAIAIEPQLAQALHLTGTLAFAPQRLPRARPVAGPPFGQGHAHRLAVHPRQHQDFAAVVLLRDRRHQPVRAEFDLAERALDRIAHRASPLDRMPSPAAGAIQTIQSQHAQYQKPG